MKEKSVLTESSPEAAKESKRGKEGQGKGPGEITKLRWYEICVQECLYSCAQAMDDRALGYAKLEKSELCFNWESGAQS